MIAFLPIFEENILQLYEVTPRNELDVPYGILGVYEICHA